MATATTTAIIDIPRGDKIEGWDDWKWQLRNSVRDLSAISWLSGCGQAERRRLEAVISEYPFGITPYYLSLINKDDPHDPIRAQCVPSAPEASDGAELDEDPLGEEDDSVMPGLVHRYPDRVLVTLTDMCPVYCRHCTRKREWRRGRWVRTHQELEGIYTYIKGHAAIRDVILSGGDPLVLSTERLGAILRKLRSIEHVEIIRIGTRCPVVLPQRVDDELVNMLKRYRPIWVNTHFNHPREITPESARACERIVSAGIPVNNQSVLLKGVNDDTATMTELCRGLLKISVRPYYLFQCDPVRGTAHLRTPIDKGLEIIKGMRGYTSGLGVPTFVVDGLSGHGKVPLGPDYLVSIDADRAVLRSYKGEVFRYHNPK